MANTNKRKRKPFFIRGNFQITFVIVFGILLFIEVMAGCAFIYRLSAQALEKAIFISHITIERSSQVIKPIILKVNTYIILISVILASLLVAITYLKRRAIFGKIINGLESLKKNNTAFRINLSGGKNSRELIKEFNQAASFLDKRLGDLRLLLNSLLTEEDLKQIAKLHDKLYSIIAR